MEKLDVLNREPFVDQVATLINNISDNKSSVTFSINGIWGSGKSFVLDMLEKKLNEYMSEETAKEKFFVIRYNCWKYDYYEEPLIAIVSALTSFIEEKTKILDEKTKERVLGMLKATSLALLSIGKSFLKEKLGFDVQILMDAVKTVKDGDTAGKEAYEKAQEYDAYFRFKEVMNCLSETLKILAEECTLVFLVDELDRCVPEYAIKILERLHHLTEDSKNMITVISIDKQQLESGVKQVFGFDKPEKYLEKFIHFGLDMDTGIVADTILKKYADYVSLFDEKIFPVPDSIEEFFQKLFDGIGVRTQEQIMQRVSIAHKALFSDKKDYAFMCTEVLIAVMIFAYQYNRLGPGNTFIFSKYDDIFTTSEHKNISFSKFFGSKIDGVYFPQTHSEPGIQTSYYLPTSVFLYPAILYLWCHTHEGTKKIFFHCNKEGGYGVIYDHPSELRKFANFIKLLSKV